MEYQHLTCNFKDCYKELKDQAYVTFCSHIFCVDHGEKMKASTSAGCLACKEPLMDHQIMETNLNVSKIHMKLILAGHNPKTIVEVSNSALSFWDYQKKHEYQDMKRSLDHYRSKLQSQSKIVDDMSKEKDSKINILLAENKKLTEEKNALKLEVASKSEKIQKAKKAKLGNCQN